MRALPVPLVLSLLLVATCALPGCSTLRPPRVAVGEAELTQRSDEAVRFDIDLDLANPNIEPLELRRLTYTVTVNGVRAFQGRRAAEATLSSEGGKSLTIPAVIRFDRMGWEPGAYPDEVDWSVRGRLMYVTPGAIAEILLDSGVRKPRVGFRGSGRVSLAAQLDE
jgi:hypothetical protein